MGSFVEEYSCLVLTHILYEAALVFAVFRYVLSWALSFRNRTHSHNTHFSSSSESNNPVHSHASVVSLHLIRESLTSTTYGDVNERVRSACNTCAVCLNKLVEEDCVRELRNCRHVFHKECIDRWIDHDDHEHDHDHDHDDNRKTCPLCRTPLLTASQSLVWAKSEPSWAVERILYLFGDDLP